MNTVLHMSQRKNAPSGKTVVLVHPNPETLTRLFLNLKKDGHTVHAFAKVKEANKHIHLALVNYAVISKVIVPKNLKVFHNYTYKSFLNRTFPELSVLTIDDKDYRDVIDINLSKDEYLASIFERQSV